MSKTHELKSHPRFFDALKRGDKNFEIRRNDRNYQCGDTLIIRGYDPTFGLLLGEPALYFIVTYVMNTEDFPAIQAGFVIMGIKPITNNLTWPHPDATEPYIPRLGHEATLNTSEPGNVTGSFDWMDDVTSGRFRIVASQSADDWTNVYIDNKRIAYVDCGKLFLIGKEGHAEPICDVDDLDCLPTLLRQHYKAI